MDIVQALVLALVQGATEFLPISSSAHLVITSKLLGWQDQGLAFDLGLHLGTLGAVVVYFRRDLYAYTGIITRWHHHPKWREVVLLGVASLPAAVLGLLVADWVNHNLRSLLVIVGANFVFALVLWWADRHSRNTQPTATALAMPWAWAFGIGCAQAVAFVPGTSRSGVTLSAALLLGLSRKEAARFSFLLSIPVILGGGLLALGDVVSTGTKPNMGALAIAISVAFVAALACIGLFMRFIERLSLLVFVVYRVLLGIFLLVWMG